jgi:prepilin-type processing-associated H-X9-DG protein
MILGNDHAYPWYANTADTNTPLPNTWWFNQLEREGLGTSQVPTNFYTMGAWQCPTAQWDDPDPTEHVSYGYNAYGGLRIGNWTNNLGLGGHYSEVSHNLVMLAPIAESEVPVPGDMIAIGDSFNGAVALMRHTNQTAAAYARHGGRVMVLFCDGHVESPTLHVLFEDSSDTSLARWNRDHQPHRDQLGL